MTMQTAALSPSPVAPPPANQPLRSASDDRDDAFGAALKAADQNRINARQAAAAKDKSVAKNEDGTPSNQQAKSPSDPQWLANFAAMIGHLQPPAQVPAPVPVVDASVAPSEVAANGAATLTGITADPAAVPDDTASDGDDAVLAQLADDATSSPRSKRSAGVTTSSELSSPASAKGASNDPSANARGQELAAGNNVAPATAGTSPVAAAAKSVEPAADTAAPAASAVETSGVETIATPTTAHGHTPATQTTLARADAPTIPGAATPLHGQALQGRLDEALKWMAGNGVQTAQIQITPDELGPITVQVHLQGAIANVLFSSAHEQTRQVLESSLGGLRDALAAGGLSLGQASVGSEQQQRNMFAGTESGERRSSDTDPAFSVVEGTAPTPTLATAQRTAGVTRQGTGLVNIYA